MTKGSILIAKISVTVTALFALIFFLMFTFVPMIVYDVRNYLMSGVSLFFPSTQPINILWFLPEHLQFLPFTFQQILDLAIIGTISNHVGSIFCRHYLKCKENMNFRLEAFEILGNTSPNQYSPIALLNGTLPYQFPTIQDFDKENLLQIRAKTVRDFQQNFVCMQCIANRNQQFDMNSKIYLFYSTRTRFLKKSPTSLLGALIFERFCFRQSSKISAGYYSLLLTPPLAFKRPLFCSKTQIQVEC
ncbi:MAG: hypothetical protein RBG13Loki_1374 [Promethearchaeota archaeon CR_4]|nr:MAG: hypothetical protein RBG13Loki_1374 [Candidatus Lokiarchaeota archaeon CR_4]